MIEQAGFPAIERYLKDSAGNLSTSIAGPSDAFGRIRVSEPETLFDSKLQFDAQPLFWDDQEVSGGSTTSSHSTATSSSVMGVALNTAGKRIRQTFMRFNYQPGKSQLVLMTGTLKSGGGTGITREMGLFDDNNGIFAQDAEGTIKFVVRSKTTGSVVDDEVAQASWSGDRLDGSGPSGLTLDVTKSQIVCFDFEWLGVGSVRCGFVINGMFILCHTFHHANLESGVYMSTPNLPLRYSIENDGTGAASTLEHICSTVIAEGGDQPVGTVRYKSTEGAAVTCTTENTLYTIIGIRLKSTALNSVVHVLDVATQIQTASELGEWVLVLNPTVTGTFTYADMTNSTVQVALGVGATVTGGTHIIGGYGESGAGASKGGGDRASVPSSIHLGSTIAGVSDTMVLCWRPIGGTAAHAIEGSITWREIR